MSIFSNEREEENSGQGQTWVAGLFVSLLAVGTECRVFFDYQPHANQVTDVQATPLTPSLLLQIFF